MIKRRRNDPKEFKTDPVIKCINGRYICTYTEMRYGVAYPRYLHRKGWYSYAGPGANFITRSNLHDILKKHGNTRLFVKESEIAEAKKHSEKFSSHALASSF